MEIFTYFLFVFCVSTIYAKPSGNAVERTNPHTNIDERSIDWLQRFGYFVRPDPRVGELVSESMLSKSLAQLQRFAGLKITGVLDSETKKLIGKSRCGMPDFGPADLTKRRKRRYALQGSKWNKKDLTWRLTNDNNDGLSRGTVERILERAFDKWAKVTTLKFTQIRSGEADIMVSFERYYHQDAYPFDGRGGLLAHAFYPGRNEGIDGDVHFDDDEEFTHETTAGKNFYFIAVHEIGHSLGLEHSNARDAIMYPWYSGYKGKEFDLTYDDTVGIQSIYGSPLPESTQAPASTLTPGTEVLTTLPPSLCLNQVKAVFLDRDDRTFIMNDDKLYILRKTLGVEKGPIAVSSYFEGVKSVDAAYRRSDGKTVLFSGKYFHVFDGTSKVSGPTRIIDYYSGITPTIEKIDAAFVWSGNGRTYLFSNGLYWRFDKVRQSIDPGYPKTIVPNWKGVPANIDAVFTWRNGKTYFFKGSKYYRITNSPLKVDYGYPKSIQEEWMKCNSALIARDTTNNGNAIHSSTPFKLLPALLTVMIAKLLQ